MEISNFYILLRFYSYIYDPFKDRVPILIGKLFYLGRMEKTVYEVANLFCKRELFSLS